MQSDNPSSSDCGKHPTLPKEHDGAAQTNSGTELAAETIGEVKDKISVEISTRFLKHFSEQLYASPQKAFEELICNGWDAGATFVDVRVPENLDAPNAALTILDNGESMDADGLKALWKIASSSKESMRELHGRLLVGKFGIGKLASYVLAERITYMCKASDGITRRVTMDYADIDSRTDADKLVSDLDLDLYELDEGELSEAIASLPASEEIKSLVDADVSGGDESLDGNDNNEFGHPRADLDPPEAGTWTLVILSGLKPAGKDLKTGFLERRLKAALPMSSEISIRMNGRPLTSLKSETDVSKSWRIGEELEFDSFSMTQDGETEGQPVSIQIGKDARNGATFHYADISGIGRVTGTITLFEDKISGGKSEARGFSNGFFVNVLGRIVNQKDPSFGLTNLSHAVWAKFRMAVRADGLHEFLVTNREGFQENRELEIFRAFLRKCFNLARVQYDKEADSMPHSGDTLVQSLGIVSLASLRSIISETLVSQSPLPDLLDDAGIGNRGERLKEWKEKTSEDIKSVLDAVKYEDLEGDEFVKFRLADNSIVVNKKHPFVAEHSSTRE